jgi:hypothetical protein
LSARGPDIAGSRVGQLREHVLAVGVKQLEALLLVAVACAHQLGIGANLADRHAGRPEPGDQRDPGQAPVAVAPLARAMVRAARVWQARGVLTS